MKLQEAREFVARFNSGGSTPEEDATFLRWLTVASTEELTIIANTHEAMQGSWLLTGGPTDEWTMQLERKLDRSIRERDRAGEESVRGVERQVVDMRGRKGGWRNWMAAASAAVLLLGAGYLFVRQVPTRTGAPENAGHGLSMTVSTPRGAELRKFDLPDGSEVWLKAGSTLRYPAEFTGDERLVELTGDAFFDVRARSGRPFQVRIRDADVEVLGTYFEVMAYADEPESRTTLVDGALRITSGHNSEVLKPGEEAVITYPSPGEGAELRILSGIDIKEVLAWRNGIYKFNHTDLRTILRVLARRYDLSVTYQAGLPDPSIDGSLDFSKSLGIVIEQLNSSLPKEQHIRLKINGKTLTVISN